MYPAIERPDDLELLLHGALRVPCTLSIRMGRAKDMPLAITLSITSASFSATGVEYFLSEQVGAFLKSLSAFINGTTEGAKLANLDTDNVLTMYWMDRGGKYAGLAGRFGDRLYDCLNDWYGTGGSGVAGRASSTPCGSGPWFDWGTRVVFAGLSVERSDVLRLRTFFTEFTRR